MKYRIVNIICLIILCYSGISQNITIVGNNSSTSNLIEVCFKPIVLKIDTSNLDEYKIDSIFWYLNQSNIPIEEYLNINEITISYSDSLYSHEHRLKAEVFVSKEIEIDSMQDSTIIKVLEDEITLNLLHEITNLSISPTPDIELFSEVEITTSLPSLYSGWSNLYVLELYRNDNFIKEATVITNVIIDDCLSQKYSIKLKDEHNKCKEVSKDIDEFQIQLASPVISGEEILCPDSKIELSFINEHDFVPGYSLRWLKDGNELNSQFEPFVEITMPGNYNLSLIYPQANSCISDSDHISVIAYEAMLSLTLVLDSFLVETSNGSFSMCDNKSTTLNASLTPTSSFTWYLNNVELPNTSNNLGFDWSNLPGDRAEIKTMAQDGNCRFEEIVILNKVASPVGEIEFLPDAAELCAYEEVLIRFSSPEGNYFYNWEPPFDHQSTSEFLIDNELLQERNGENIPIRLNVRGTYINGLVCSVNIENELSILPTPIFSEFQDSLFVCSGQNFEKEIPINSSEFWDTLYWTINGLNLELEGIENNILRLGGNDRLSGKIIIIAEKVNHHKTCRDTITFQITTDLPAEPNITILNTGEIHKGQDFWITVRHPFDSITISNIEILDKIKVGNTFLINLLTPMVNESYFHILLTSADQNDCKREAVLEIGSLNSFCTFPDFDTIVVRALSIINSGNIRYGLQILSNESFFQERHNFRWGRLNKSLNQSQEFFPVTSDELNLPYKSLTTLDTTNYWYFVDVNYKGAGCNERFWLGGKEAVLQDRSIEVFKVYDDENKINIFPNPVNEFVKVLCKTATENENWTIELFSSSGKRFFYQNNISGHEIATGYTIMMSGTAAGVYSMRIYSDSGKIYGQKIIKL